MFSFVFSSLQRRTQQVIANLDTELVRKRLQEVSQSFYFSQKINMQIQLVSLEFHVLVFQNFFWVHYPHLAVLNALIQDLVTSDLEVKVFCRDTNMLPFVIFDKKRCPSPPENGVILTYFWVTYHQKCPFFLKIPDTALKFQITFSPTK